MTARCPLCAGKMSGTRDHRVIGESRTLLKCERCGSAATANLVIALVRAQDAVEELVHRCTSAHVDW